MGFEVRIEGAEVRFACRPDESVLQAMLQRGQRCVDVGCRSGGCGVCRVQIVAGEFESGQMSRDKISAADRLDRIALACQVFPRSDLHLRVLGLPRGSDPTSQLLRSVYRSRPSSDAAAA